MKARLQLAALASILTTAIAPMTWGTTYLVTTELLPAGRPLLAGLLRALPAGIALAAITRSRPQGTWWFKAALLGILNIGGFFALLFLAAFRLPGGVAGTLGAIQPLLAAALAAALLGERMRQKVLFAGVLGVTGVGLLVLGAEAKLDAIGVFAGLGRAAAMAMGVVLTKRWGRPTSLLAFTSWQLIAGGLFLLPLALMLEGVPQTISTANIAGFLLALKRRDRSGIRSVVPRDSDPPRRSSDTARTVQPRHCGDSRMGCTRTVSEPYAVRRNGDRAVIHLDCNVHPWYREG